MAEQEVQVFSGWTTSVQGKQEPLPEPEGKLKKRAPYDKCIGLHPDFPMASGSTPIFPAVPWEVLLFILTSLTGRSLPKVKNALLPYCSMQFHEYYSCIAIKTMAQNHKCSVPYFIESDFLIR